METSERCPKCGSEPRRDAVLPSNPGLQRFLCDSYFNAKGELYWQSPQCRTRQELHELRAQLTEERRLREEAERELSELRNAIAHYRRVRGESFGPFNPTDSARMRECEEWAKVLPLLAAPQAEGGDDGK